MTLRVFTNGWYGRPCAIEQDAWEKTPEVEVIRWPNFDTYDHRTKQRRMPDEDPWVFLEGDQYEASSNIRYYGVMIDKIRASKPDMVITNFINDAVTGELRKDLKDVSLFCVSKEAARLEADREYQTEVMNALGVARSRSVKVRNLEEVERTVPAWNGKYVVKGQHSGTMQVEICEDLAAVREAVRKWPTRELPVVVEEFLEGFEIAFAGFVDYRQETMFYPVLTDFEYTKLCAGDIGPETGEMGIHDMAGVPRIIQWQVFEKLKPWFREVEYVGWFDVSGIFTDDGFKVFECMTRNGSTQLENVCAMMREPFWSLCLKLVNGCLHQKDIDYRFKHAVSVCVNKIAARAPTVMSEDVWEFMFRGRMFRDRGNVPCLTRINRKQVNVINEYQVITAGDMPLTLTSASNLYIAAQVESHELIERFVKGDLYCRNDIGWRYTNPGINGRLVAANLMREEGVVL